MVAALLMMVCYQDAETMVTRANHASSITALSDMPLMLSILIRCTLIGKKVKKEMRVFQSLGADDDADSLLAPAILAKRRVVVKRPDYAEPLGQKAPSAVTTKNHRFDIYPCIKNSE